MTVHHIPWDLQSESDAAVGCRSWSAPGKLTTVAPEVAIPLLTAHAHQSHSLPVPVSRYS